MTSGVEHWGQSMELPRLARGHCKCGPALRQRFLVEEPAHIATPPFSILGPVGVPVRPMRALRAAPLPASNTLLTKMDGGLGLDRETAATLQLGPGQNHESSQLVVVEVFDRVEQIAVERHYATESGANSLVERRRSVSVQPWGGVMRSAWLAQSE